MTVKEFIEMLSKFPQDAPVIVFDARDGSPNEPRLSYSETHASLVID